MNMNFLLLLLLITTTTADNYCRGIFFNQKYFNVNVIKEGVNRVHQISFNRNDNTLYFTFEQIAKVPTRVLGYLNLNTEESGVINGIRNATGIAIDQSRNKLYVGGSDGLYSIDNNNKERVAEKLPVQDDIRSMFFKDVLYYTNNRKQAFKFDFGDVTPLAELQGVSADKLIVDDDKNLFFMQNNRLFRVKIGTRAVNSHEKYIVNDIAVDGNYKPYVSTMDGVYVYNKYKYALDKVSDITGLRALSFTKVDEPIYVVVDLVVRLVFNPVPCFGD